MSLSHTVLQTVRRNGLCSDVCATVYVKENTGIKKELCQERETFTHSFAIFKQCLKTKNKNKFSTVILAHQITVIESKLCGFSEMTNI